MFYCRYVEIFRSSLAEMTYYATNSNLIKLNKLFKSQGSSSLSSSASSYSNRSFNNRAAPYTTKPAGRMNRGGASNRDNNNTVYDETCSNTNTTTTPSLFDLKFGFDNNNYDDNSSSNNNKLPSLFDNFNNYFNSFQTNFNKNNNNNNDNSDYTQDGDYSNNNNNNADDSYDHDESNSNRTGHTIKMRGLPYSVTVNDIKTVSLNFYVKENERGINFVWFFSFN